MGGESERKGERSKFILCCSYIYNDVRDEKVEMFQLYQMCETWGASLKSFRTLTKRTEHVEILCVTAAESRGVER